MDEQVLLDLSSQQHAALGRWQAAEMGFDRQWVRRRTAAGQWILASPRVLVRAGSPGTPHQRLMVQVLHDGPGAVASHRAVAWLWRLPGFELRWLDTARPGRPGCGRAGGAHQPRLWLPHHLTDVDGIPCVSLPVTIFQLAGLRIPHSRLVRVVHTVVGRSPAMLPALHRTLDELAERGRDGITEMREILAELPVGCRPAGSGTELRFEQLLERGGEQPLERQVDLGGHGWIGRFDHWDPEVRLVVEVMSDTYHGSPLDAAADDRRRRELLAAGAAHVLFLGEDQIWQRPWEVVPAVRAARAEARARLAASGG